MVATVVASPHAAGGAAHHEVRTVVAYRQRVPVDEVVAVVLRQTDAQCVEACAAVARAIDRQRTVDGYAALILDGRYEPSGLRVDGMCGYRKAERRQRRVQLAPERAAVSGAEDAVVMHHSTSGCAAQRTMACGS